MVSGTRALLEQFVIKIEGGYRAGASKWSMTYAFTHMRNFLLLLLPLLEMGGRRRRRRQLGLQALGDRERDLLQTHGIIIIVPWSPELKKTLPSLSSPMGGGGGGLEAYRVKGSSRVSPRMSPLPLKHNECMPMNALVVLQYRITHHLEEGGGVWKSLEEKEEVICALIGSVKSLNINHLLKSCGQATNFYHYKSIYIIKAFIS